MEKKKDELLKSRLITCLIVVVFSTAAFSCGLTAEFNKVKVKDMKVDGSLCSLPRTPAFGLGIAAVVCMSVAQIVGTVVGGAWLCAMDNKFSIRKNWIALAYLISSWLCYGLAAVMLGTGASMNSGQPYRKGWMDGDCYLVKNGIFGTASSIAIFASIIILGFTTTCLRPQVHQSAGTDMPVAVQRVNKNSSCRRLLQLMLCS
ncbi:hypothetical protein LUZ63_002574 [Rhynchospora breviuscula]|uniref:Uncharacterized protein n=1 Tax=Rhynchospora breviuscula TaxID=2022672 RepID=A0A9Q0HYM0_9POAL|nr:hypothetical protein LUZ63_002574 [Rhynchospora breviuscula]